MIHVLGHEGLDSQKGHPRASEARLVIQLCNKQHGGAARRHASAVQTRRKSPFVKTFIIVLVLLACQKDSHVGVSSFTCKPQRFHAKQRQRTAVQYLANKRGLSNNRVDHDETMTSTTTPDDLFSRRKAMSLLLATGSVLLSPSLVHAAAGDELENLSLGAGKWLRRERQSSSRIMPNNSNPHVPLSFVSYATRILINYDLSVQSWWTALNQVNRRLSEDERRAKLTKGFASMAKSVQLGVVDFIQDHPSPKQAYEELWDIFMKHYGQSLESRRQVALLFAMLPREDQPVERLRSASTASASTALFSGSSPESLTRFQNSLSELLPASYSCVAMQDQAYFAVHPPLGESLSFAATSFGPVADVPLVRDQSTYALSTYARLGLSGAVGCALTHAVVIPIDVVKTRTQIDSGPSGGFIKTGQQILQKEGMDGLFLGAQATLFGYLWYGVSVYPCYTFFKRYISQAILPDDFVAVNGDVIALLAGALASVVAGLGLTPLEAARIRVVADPTKYRSLGLLGTLQAISDENPAVGWRGLYSGLSSLLTRQVIFGSVKFLAFERACAYIFSCWPSLHDEAWTCLVASLFAGAFSGALSAIVSQPADAILTFIAQEGSVPNQSLWQTGVIMVQNEGVARLFRGVGSRSIWATCIIAGQFLLYDAFRASYGVSPDDLTQVYQLVLSTGSLDS